jgi:hypothetical protein
MRFHSKYHFRNHHTNPTDGYPDSASDPIASHDDPFQGDFVLVNGKIYAPSVVFSDVLSSLEVDDLTVNNNIITLSVGTLTLTSFASNTDGTNVINVDAKTLDGINSSAFELISNKNLNSGYLGIDSSGNAGTNLKNLNLSSLNLVGIDDYLISNHLSSTVAPLITSDNVVGYEIPVEFIPSGNRDQYVGFFDYNASGALSSVTLTADVWNTIENDASGLYTLTSYGPTGISRVWDESSNSFDFSELNLGDMVDIRLDISIATTSNNQEVMVDLVLAKGTPSEYRIPFVYPITFKTAGEIGIVKYNSIYIGNTDTLSGGGDFEIQTDDDATMKVNGWYCKIIRRGF